MIVTQASRTLAARSMHAVQKNQRRGILDYLTKYPDKVSDCFTGHVKSSWREHFWME